MSEDVRQAGPGMDDDSLVRETLYREYQSGFTGPEAAPYQPRPFHAYLVKTFAPQRRDATILDLGCGRGELVRFLTEAGYTNARGVDGSPSQVAARVTERVEQGDLFAFLAGVGSGSVECIFCLDVLEHLRRGEGLQFGAEARRALRDGGALVLHVPNAGGLFGGRIRYADLTHQVAFTSESLHQWGRACGFSRVECFEDKPIVHGVVSLIRRVLYEVMRLPFLLFVLAETGSARGVVLSQGMTVRAWK